MARALTHKHKFSVHQSECDNNLTESGLEALRKAEFDETSLNSAADSTTHGLNLNDPLELLPDTLRSIQ